MVISRWLKGYWYKKWNILTKTFAFPLYSCERHEFLSSIGKIVMYSLQILKEKEKF